MRGERYRSPGDEALADLIENELHYFDFDEACSFYAAVLPHLSRENMALLGCNDRYFLLTVILGRKDAINHWLYARCREVEAEPDGYLDLWAREHYKSTIITYAGIIQELMVDPELTVGIFSFNRKAASAFLKQCQNEFESNDLLRSTYVDVIWDRPRQEAPQWSLEKGIVLRRNSNPKEASIEANGLVDGMPTGKHYALMVYDDVVTPESVTNDEQVKKTTESWEMSDNLGAGEVRKWHIGTRYCTIGSMRILMADWTHKPIEDVRIGDTIVGWELRDGKRWLRPAKVVNRGVHFEQPVSRYTLENGRSVTCTEDHKWWRGAHGGGPEYAPLALPAGKRKDRPPKGKKAPSGLISLRQLLVPADQGVDRDSGWLAGMYDGEGTFQKNTNHPSGSVCIVQSMSNPDVIDEIRGCLKRLDFKWSENWWSAKDSSNQLRDRMKHDRCVFHVNGGWRERYRFVAQIRPTRLGKMAASLFGQLTTEKQKLVSVEPAGDQDVHWLETETGNYVVEGFCSSNSFADSYGVMLSRKALKPRIYPATDNGKVDGKPVFMSEKRWLEKVNTQRTTLAAQMLQNPIAGQENMFMPGWFKGWEVRPSAMCVYIMGDPSKGRSASSDRTAIAVVGIDAAGNKYLLDGFRHRMSLSERWQALKLLYGKWSTMRGVQVCQVGYEAYGLQADIEYFKERMTIEGTAFSIRELNWTRDGTTSKADRVGRLEPDFRLGRFYLPALVYRAAVVDPVTKKVGPGDCLWSIDEDQGKIIERKMREKTASMAALERLGEHDRVAKPIRRLDENRKVYDVTEALMEEMLFFPFAPHDDLVDALARIYDMEPVGPSIHEDAFVEAMSERQDFVDA